MALFKSEPWATPLTSWAAELQAATDIGPQQRAADVSLAARRTVNRIRSEWLQRAHSTPGVHAFSWLSRYIEGDLGFPVSIIHRASHRTAAVVGEGAEAESVIAPARAADATRSSVDATAAFTVLARLVPRSTQSPAEVWGQVRSLRCHFTLSEHQAERDPDSDSDGGGRVGLLGLAAAVLCGIGAHCLSLEECYRLLAEELEYLVAIAVTRHGLDGRRESLVARHIGVAEYAERFSEWTTTVRLHPIRGRGNASASDASVFFDATVECTSPLMPPGQSCGPSPMRRRYTVANLEADSARSGTSAAAVEWRSQQWAALHGPPGENSLCPTSCSSRYDAVEMMAAAARASLSPTAPLAHDDGSSKRTLAGQTITRTEWLAAVTRTAVSVLLPGLATSGLVVHYIRHLGYSAKYSFRSAVHTLCALSKDFDCGRLSYDTAITPWTGPREYSLFISAELRELLQLPPEQHCVLLSPRYTTAGGGGGDEIVVGSSSITSRTDGTEAHRAPRGLTTVGRPLTDPPAAADASLTSLTRQLNSITVHVKDQDSEEPQSPRSPASPVAPCEGRSERYRTDGQPRQVETVGPPIGGCCAGTCLIM